MSTFKMPIQQTGGPSQFNKEIKNIQTAKEEIKLPIFAVDTTIYVENLKESTKRLLEPKLSLARL